MLLKSAFVFLLTVQLCAGQSTCTTSGACLPGTFSVTGTGTCTACSAGTFQAVAGSTACDTCTPGYYCAEGSAAPLPCPGGTHKDLTLAVMTTVDDCVICPSGTSCPVGSAQPVPCLPGSYSALSNAMTCDLCSNGEFQRAYGQSACEACVPGFYCKQGAAEPVPCPAGYVSNATGLYSPGQCTPVPIGFWAPLGSNIPEPCPASGFYCPGTLRDNIHGGARPVVMPTGQSTATQQVPSVTQQIAVAISLDDFVAQKAALTQALATGYGVPTSLVTLEMTTGPITLTIATTDGTSSNSVGLAALGQAVAAVDDTALATTIRAVIGTTVAVTSQPPTVGTTSIVVPFICPRGKWCTAGLVIDCPQHTYNPNEGASAATACLPCPAHSSTAAPTATAASDCTCDAGYNASGALCVIADGSGFSLAYNSATAQCEISCDGGSGGHDHGGSGGHDHGRRLASHDKNSTLAPAGRFAEADDDIAPAGRFAAQDPHELVASYLSTHPKLAAVMGSDELLTHFEALEQLFGQPALA